MGAAAKTGRLPVRFFLSDLDEIQSISVLLQIADHRVARTIVRLTIPERMVHKRMVYLYRLADWEVIKAALSSTDWGFVAARSVDEAALNFTRFVIDILDRCIL